LFLFYSLLECGLDAQFLSQRSIARESFICLGQARAPYGVDNARDTLPRVRQDWRSLGPLFGCFLPANLVKSHGGGVDFA